MLKELKKLSAYENKNQKNLRFKKYKWEKKMTEYSLDQDQENEQFEEEPYGVDEDENPRRVLEIYRGGARAGASLLTGNPRGVIRGISKMAWYGLNPQDFIVEMIEKLLLGQKDFEIDKNPDHEKPGSEM